MGLIIENIQHGESSQKLLILLKKSVNKPMKNLDYIYREHRKHVFSGQVEANHLNGPF